MNYAGSYKEFEIVIVTLIFSDVVPQLNSHSLFPALSRGNLSVALLHFVIHCSVFKVHPLTTLAIRFEDLTEVRSSNPTTNVVWWARVGSNHRPYDYQSYALAS